MNPLTLDSRASLAEAFFAISTALPESTVYEYSSPTSGEKNSARIWKAKKYSEVRLQVLKIAAYLRSIGVTRGTRVAILSSTRPEWMEADLAIQSLGAVTVAIYQSVTTSDVGYILFDSKAQFVFAENQEQVEKLLILISAPVAIPAFEEHAARNAQILLNAIITFERSDKNSLVNFIGDIPSPTNLESSVTDFQDISRQDLAALVYTSGTTGPPKGVMQTHGNHLSNVRQAYQSGLFSDNTSIMLFLPLAHSFAKLMGYIGFLTTATVKFPAITNTQSSKLSPESISRDIREGSASLVPIVPRLLEKMESGISAKALAGGVMGMLVAKTISAREGSLTHLLLAPIRNKIKNTLFGPNFICAVSGGAKLSIDTAKFFERLQITVLQGYGLTETVVATNVNRIASNRIGTVGPALAADIEIKINDAGEILFRGPNISPGYLNRPSATAAAWDAEGWFHTGDLGALSADGFLSITGRKKELIVTSNGKKIAPEIIEQRIKANCALISQIIMYGEGRSYNVALITVNLEVAAKVAAKRNVKQDIEEHIKRVNKELSNFEAIHSIHIVDEEFSIENGLLTPTFKAKRNAVYARYAEEITALYDAK